jgi:hypothetical protein
MEPQKTLGAHPVHGLRTLAFGLFHPPIVTPPFALLCLQVFRNILQQIVLPGQIKLLETAAHVPPALSRQLHAHRTVIHNVQRAIADLIRQRRELQHVSHAPHVHRDSMKARLASPLQTAYVLHAKLCPVHPVSI